jgi:DnaJ-class molecular chaperone
MTHTILIDCPGCNGEGVIAHLWSYDPRNGEPVGSREICDLCHGEGVVEEELLAIEQEDLDERDGGQVAPEA